MAEVGPEVVAGSTRMKAGTAQKMILNMLTTGAMTRLGYVYGNLMVNLHLKNEKLAERGIGILEKAAELSRADAREFLRDAHNSVPVALVMAKAAVGRSQAAAALKNPLATCGRRSRWRNLRRQDARRLSPCSYVSLCSSRFLSQLQTELVISITSVAHLTSPLE